jgi:hypothetical protein
MNMSRRKKLLLIAPLAILGMVLFTFIGGQLVMWLWNWLTPSLFGWKQIGFWQALGLLALCRILFGNFGGRGGPRKSRMSLEEREGFRRRMRDRCGSPPAATMTDHAERPVQ